MANHEEYRVKLKAGLVPALTDSVRQLDAFFLDQQKLLPAHGAYHGAMEIAEAVPLYGVIRQTKPAQCVETGVANSLSSAFILEALRVNGGGSLISIDLPGFSQQAAAQAGASSDPRSPDPTAVIPRDREASGSTLWAN